MKNRFYHRQKLMVVFGTACILLLAFFFRLSYLMLCDAKEYREKALALHQRERKIKAPRGEILDRNGLALAKNKAVCTVSVIHNQMKKPKQTAFLLSKMLAMDFQELYAKVRKVSAMEIIKTNVEKHLGDRIRQLHLAGVKVDEDFRRFYPWDTLASRVLGFTGSDNQGIIGLEVAYERVLKGKNGCILTETDARGVELTNQEEKRVEPVPGDTLETSLDYHMQTYCQQAARKAMEEKQAKGVSILLMNPQNGEIYAMVNQPEFHLNAPYTSPDGEDFSKFSGKRQREALNRMWRNPCINDTYEPGSTFKVITAAACLEEGEVGLQDTFSCPGFRVVEGRRIRCHKAGGHGQENFVQGIQNSCNPVFIDIGLRLGAKRFYGYFQRLGLFSKTKVDLPGEAGTIMHQEKEMGPVEVATMAFGQSFQITPIQLLTTISSIINGGRRITPHIAVAVRKRNGKRKKIRYRQGKRVLSRSTCETMKALLESVVKDGSGRNAYIEGYRVGGKTATSQTLPRSANRYISSFVGFAPAKTPVIIGMVIIHEPQGIYYGGTIAAPVLRRIFEWVLPYLKVEKEVEQGKKG